jgi:quercetin dioxygenase-like cupin family protein
MSGRADFDRTVDDLQSCGGVGAGRPAPQLQGYSRTEQGHDPSQRVSGGRIPTVVAACCQVARCPFPRQEKGAVGPERVNRFATAPRFEAGPNTSFIDFFNADLIPGLEMSGGYGLFQPGGRLPAHVHDFDESICIIAGTATCNVEGRRRALSGGATAMVPRGRVHYFINETTAPMAMLWVYAGPLPLRVVVAEACATEDGRRGGDGCFARSGPAAGNSAPARTTNAWGMSSDSFATRAFVPQNSRMSPLSSCSIELMCPLSSSGERGLRRTTFGMSPNVYRSGARVCGLAVDAGYCLS